VPSFLCPPLFQKRKEGTRIELYSQTEERNDKGKFGGKEGTKTGKLMGII
jgi:hypothetical protein